MFDIGKLIDFPKLLVDQAIAVLIAFLAISYINPTTKGGVFVLGAVVVVTVNAVVVMGRVLRRALLRWNERPRRRRSKSAAIVLTTTPADVPRRPDSAEVAPDSIVPSPPPLPETPSPAAAPTTGNGQDDAQRAKPGSPATSAA
jgi:hypothetical protein